MTTTKKHKSWLPGPHHQASLKSHHIIFNFVNIRFIRFKSYARQKLVPPQLVSCYACLLWSCGRGTSFIEVAPFKFFVAHFVAWTQKIVHLCFLGFGPALGDNTTRTASSNICFKPFCVSAEHSMYLTAPILDASFSPASFLKGVLDCC